MLSVIIPTYNSETTLGPLLDALTASTEPTYEIIVVDDGSTDGTRELASSYPVTLKTTGGRCGPATARNCGARSAQGEVLLFLDSDTLPAADLLTHVAHRFDADPELAALVGYYDTQPLNPGAFPRYKALLVHYWFRDNEVMESFETCCGAIRKTVFERAGGFDERYTGAEVEDYEFGHRVLEQGPILIDHHMIVRHHFPSFAKNLRNYYHRARLWMMLFLARRRFESTATTPAEGFNRLLAVTATMACLAGVRWTPLAYVGSLLLLLYLVGLRGLVAFLAAEETYLFAARGIVFHLANSFAITLGVIVACVEYPVRGWKRTDGVA